MTSVIPPATKESMLTRQLQDALAALGLRYPKWLESAMQTPWDTQLMLNLRALLGFAGSTLILDQGDSFHFWSGLYAGILSGQSIIIPPNYQAGTLMELSEIYPHAQRYSQLTQQPYLASDSKDAQIRFDGLAQTPLSAITLTLFTSGTSDAQGRGKAIHKTVSQMCAEAVGIQQSLSRVSQHGCLFSTVPNHHLYGLTFSGFWAFQQGLSVSLETLETPEDVAAAVKMQSQRYPAKPIILVTTPSQLIRFPALVGAVSLQACQTIFTAGSPLPENTAQWLAEHHVYPQEIYGSTETGALATRRQCESLSWQPLQGVKLNWYTETVYASTPWISDACPLADRLLPTQADRFVLDGRADRVVKIAEKRVDLGALEAMLRQHPWIADVAMVIVMRQRLSIGALVVLNAAGQIMQKEIKPALFGQQLRAHLTRTFDQVVTPKYWRYLTQLPYDERGKLSTHRLQAYFSEGDAIPMMTHE